MHGNVQEWVQDWFEEYYYFDSPPEDPLGPKRGTLRTVRGGCWAMLASDCRSAARRGHAPDAHPTPSASAWCWLSGRAFLAFRVRFHRSHRTCHRFRCVEFPLKKAVLDIAGYCFFVSSLSPPPWSIPPSICLEIPSFIAVSIVTTGDE